MLLALLLLLSSSWHPSCADADASLFVLDSEEAGEAGTVMVKLLGFRGLALFALDRNPTTDRSICLPFDGVEEEAEGASARQASPPAMLLLRTSFRPRPRLLSRVLLLCINFRRLPMSLPPSSLSLVR